ncbi:MAG TPA: VTT domain-containing protein [Hyalangium sp.]|nr:VTT domain-containing protein [Hyalangium sp.]
MLAAIAALVILAWSIWDRAALASWKGEAAPLPFFAAMAVLPLFGMPITPFFVLAGATFGTRLGLLGSGLALGLNLAVSYWLAHTAIRPWLKSLLRRLGYELPDYEKKKEGAVRFTLSVKLAPGIPAFVKNYGLGVSGVPFALYLSASMLITGLYAAALILLGESLFEHDLNRSIVAGAVILVAALGLWWWRRSARSRAPA